MTFSSEKPEGFSCSKKFELSQAIKGNITLVNYQKIEGILPNGEEITNYEFKV